MIRWMMVVLACALLGACSDDGGGDGDGDGDGDGATSSNDGDGDGSGSSSSNTEEYCYEYSCGAPTGKKCFSSQSAYCDSVCAEADSCAQEDCDSNC